MTFNIKYPLITILFSILLIYTIIPAIGLIGAPLLTVDTDKTNYEAGEVVLVSGKVSHEIMKTGESLVIEIFNPDGQIYRSDSVNVTWGGLLSDGSYAYEFKIEGKLALKGDYEILVTYEGQQAVTIVTYLDGDIDPEHYHVFVVKIGSKTYPIRYKVTEGSRLNSIFADPDTKSLYVQVTSKTDRGQLTLELSRKLIDAKEGSDGDTNYTIAIGALGGAMIYTDAFKEIHNNGDKRTLVIDLLGNVTNDILIRGTQVVPEFPIAIMIASIAISFVLGIMRLTAVKLFLH